MKAPLYRITVTCFFITVLVVIKNLSKIHWKFIKTYVVSFVVSDILTLRDI